jgi:hypothetical protein
MIRRVGLSPPYGVFVRVEVTSWLRQAHEPLAVSEATEALAVSEATEALAVSEAPEALAQASEVQ